MNSKKTTAAFFALSFAGSLLAQASWAEEEPKCHVYLPSSGWTTNVRAQVRTQYSSQNLCKSQLSGLPCYRYFESREACRSDDASLVNLFLMDAERDGQIISNIPR
ncbi:hypothetical protein Maes01_01801 [Microbulbifer aestuariivivens]|uniref:DUF3551 domain-containing protein n=1 Tax=Microbulbifer aestuariivivens TaxID=1908308 RepID=A0ABP9WSX4_9GAMM